MWPIFWSCWMSSITSLHGAYLLLLLMVFGAYLPLVVYLLLGVCLPPWDLFPPWDLSLPCGLPVGWDLSVLSLPWCLSPRPVNQLDGVYLDPPWGLHPEACLAHQLEEACLQIMTGEETHHQLIWGHHPACWKLGSFGPIGKAVMTANTTNMIHSVKTFIVLWINCHFRGENKQNKCCNFPPNTIYIQQSASLNMWHKWTLYNNHKVTHDHNPTKNYISNSCGKIKKTCIRVIVC